MKQIFGEKISGLGRRLARLYGPERATELLARLQMRIRRLAETPSGTSIQPQWTKRSAILITYPDIVRETDLHPLMALRNFCGERFAGCFDTLHVLPFFPASSDGGFSVIDYREVDPTYGTWDDVRALAGEWHLMVDLVLNHCSRESPMFERFRNGRMPECDFFIEENQEADLSQVVRPRVTPLLTPVETAGGLKHVWTTFSADQVDFNWRCPDVLFEFLDILLFYIRQGARVIRLDAVAFLWKERGTSCLHLSQTHEVVKLLRAFLSLAAPEVVLLTETNVPHRENVSYFGNSDEAHAVYQFSLPPLLLHALLRGDASHLACWLMKFGTPPPGCTFLNFTASHDGVGVRPLEGLLPDEELSFLARETLNRGGMISRRRMQSGEERPYELNIAWRDLLDIPGNPAAGLQRFLCSQAVALALRGIPAIWFHNMVGTRNWLEGVAKGEPRDINRRRWERVELDAALAAPSTGMNQVLLEMTALLRVRRCWNAFHPDGPQEILCPTPELLGIGREQPDGSQRVLCWFNFSDHPASLPDTATADFLGAGALRDVLAEPGASEVTSLSEVLGPWQFRWLARRELA